jgi:Dolichyl-phosphate-mannose-protein mannosyltransferase
MSGRSGTEATKVQPNHYWDRETAFVAQLAACVSFISFAYYFQHGGLLLYGDAVAHINIARRVFDSQTPGLLQLGTVWLPLPHLLMIPFLLSDSAWQSGIGGAIPSMVAYVLGTAGIFRLVRSALSVNCGPSPTGRIAAWLSAVVYAANPNLIYLQTTAMTESVYLALFVWAMVYFNEFVRQSPRSDESPAAISSLTKCGLCLVGACLTRYDGWFLAVAMCVTVLAVAWKRNNPSLRRGIAKFVLLAAAAPVVWLAYNAIIYRNPLEFANGPYSARAIEQKNATPGSPPHPGSHDLPVAFSYFLKSAELNMSEASLQKVWVTLILAATIGIVLRERRLWPLLLLWAPVPFYMLSIAYSGVPVFLPTWWPFSFYNVRYGLQLLPLFSISAGVTVYFLLRLAQNKIAKTAVLSAVAILLGISYASVWRAEPVCYREAWVNSRTRIAFETELASDLKKLRYDSTLLMYLGDHVGALEQAGIHLRRTVNEGNHRPWRSPDPDGLWEHALAKPGVYVDWVVAIDGDPVALAMQKLRLPSIAVIRTAGQPTATIYWAHKDSL